MKNIKNFENFDSRGMGTFSGMDHPGSLAGWENSSKGKEDNIPEIEQALVDLFRGFNNNNTWVADRFNDEETINFVKYLNNKLK